jgi:HEAT repeat protein
MIALLSVATVGLATACAADLADQKERMSSPDYEMRKAVVTELLRTGETRPLSRDEITLLLPHFASDPDWRIKVRIASVLPFAAEKTQTLQPLVAALKERDDKASGGGNLQIASCRALAEIGDKAALPAMREWLAFLKSNPAHFKLLKDALIRQTEECIKELEKKPMKEGSNKARERD